MVTASAVPDDGLAMMLISIRHIKRSLFNRKWSRISRLILFLVTAFPTFFDTVIPRRDLASWFFWEITMNKSL
jgi:hypothetical protein